MKKKYFIFLFITILNASDESQQIQSDAMSKQDYEDAQFNLGEFYTKSCGVKKNIDKPVEFFTKFAHQGDLGAQSQLEDSQKH